MEFLLIGWEVVVLAPEFMRPVNLGDITYGTGEL